MDTEQEKETLPLVRTTIPNKYIEEPKLTKMDLLQTCEVIFQLHKSQKGVTWAKEILREYQLASTARTKLLQEKIILNPTYGDRTQLNPEVHDCDSYEQALSLLKHKNKYTLSVFTYLKQNGYNGEYFWSTISSACNIPIEESEDTKNILYHQEYIYKSNSTDHGDLVKANPHNITAALHGLENKPTSNTTTIKVKQTFKAGRDLHATGNRAGVNEESDETSEINKEGLVISKKALYWTIAGVILAAIIWLWPELRKALSSLF